MTARRALPNRRRCETFSFEHGGFRYEATVGFYPDWTPAELFLTAGKPGSAVETISRDAAVALSLALQFGCPLSVLRDAMTRLDPYEGRNEAAGPLGKLLDIVGDAMKEPEQ